MTDTAPAFSREADRNQGYWMSSLDLSRGLEVRPLAAQRVGLPLLRELLRQQSQWPGEPKPLRMASPSAASTPAPAVVAPDSVDLLLDLTPQAEAPLTLSDAPAMSTYQSPNALLPYRSRRPSTDFSLDGPADDRPGWALAA